MKNKIKYSIIIGLIILITLIYIRQNGSIKGNWSESDKNRFRKELEATSEVSKFGKFKTDFIECCISKGEENYSSFAALCRDEIGITKISNECCKYIVQNISIKGKWSIFDKNEFQKDLESEKDLMSKLGSNKNKYIECISSKLEMKYSSYAESNKDEVGFEKIMNECLFDALSNGSTKGKWSESDKNRFRKEMESYTNLPKSSKVNFIECCLSKCETRFSSYFECNTNLKDCEKISLACKSQINE